MYYIINYSIVSTYIAAIHTQPKLLKYGKQVIILSSTQN